MNKRNLGILLLENNRSRAYLQSFIRAGYLPRFALFMKPDGAVPVRAPDIQRVAGFDCWFDAAAGVEQTLRDHGIPYQTFPHLDVNAPDVVACVGGLQLDAIVFSGPAGSILRDGILSAGPPFIHAHPGTLPGFKGSTTLYYSMLYDGTVGCSVIEMTRDLDSGNILLMRSWPVPRPPLDYDMVLDPLVRAEALVAWLDQAEDRPRANAQGNTFYIIHPVLKHLARRRAAAEQGQEAGSANTQAEREA